MHDAAVGQSEFNRAVVQIRDDIRLARDDSTRQVGGVNARLDVLNGQTRRHGEAIATHGEAIATLRSEVDDLDATDDAQAIVLRELSAGFTRIETLITAKTKAAAAEAVQDTLPTKKIAAGLVAVGGVGIEVVRMVFTYLGK